MNPGCNNIVKQMASKFSLWEDTHVNKEGTASLVSSVDIDYNSTEQTAVINLVLPGKDSQFQVSTGSKQVEKVAEDFVETVGTKRALLNMLLAHSVGDFCLVGNRGSGKTALINQFARKLGYGEPVTMMLYQDMTGRDLLQQRITRKDGSTGWELSPVLKAAVEGNLLVLDGVHVLNSSTLLVMKRLIEDREAFLPDGSRSLNANRYETLKQKLNYNDEEMTKNGILKIHPSFRIIATAEPPTASKTSTSQQKDKAKQIVTTKHSSPGPWLTPDVNALFLFVKLDLPNEREEIDILTKLHPNVPSHCEKLVKIDGSILSLRQKLRILHLLETYEGISLYDAVISASLQRFMSLPAKTALNEILLGAQIKPPATNFSTSRKEDAMEVKVDDDFLQIGGTRTPIYKGKPEVEGHINEDPVFEAMRVPSVLFFDNDRQVRSMESMLKSLLAGEHLLVIGNQGVGKNRIVDRLLQLWQRPRHYAQLHRDSTVQSLTVTPAVSGGKLHFEDSPLVKAVKTGHILVLDEVDKAPVHVTRVLKGLVESGTMLLPDGRKISKYQQNSKDIIHLHPEFRMIVLANPPGYPFLGNNFFASLGDLFSCHIIDNPDFESELELLRNYAGENFDMDLLKRLTAGFSELRNKANEGLLPYPYSTRELVNVVKHLAKYPTDTATDALRNVFDFDNWNDSALDAAQMAFGKYGIAIENRSENAPTKLTRIYQLPALKNVGNFQKVINNAFDMALGASSKLTFDGPSRVEKYSIAVDQIDGRMDKFSELTRCFSLDLPDHCTVQDALVTHSQSLAADVLHLSTANPELLISFPLRYDTRNGSMIMLRKHIHSPYLKLYPFLSDDGGHVLLFDSRSGHISSLNVESGILSKFKESLIPMESYENKDKPWQHAGFVPFSGKRPFNLAYRPCSNGISFVDFVTGDFRRLDMPFPVKNVSPYGESSWMITSEDNQQIAILSSSGYLDSNFKAKMQIFKTTQYDSINEFGNVERLSDHQHLALPSIGNIIGSNFYSVIDSSNGESFNLLTSRRSIEIFKTDENEELDASDREIRSFLSGPKENIETNDSIYLPNHSMMVSSLSNKRKYSVGSFSKMALASTSDVESVMEICHVPNTDNSDDKATICHVPILKSSDSIRARVVRLLPLTNQDVVSVMSNGVVRVWEVIQGRIQHSLSTWNRRMGINSGGGAGGDTIEMTIKQLLQKKMEEARKVPPPQFGGPKHGKVDPDNAPHVGGNQWQGGSGGRDTAGMGGAGGPYRIDSGNPITQVPDWVKDQVPEHIKQAAREVAQRTYAERLKQIKMSPFDAQLYDKYASRIKREVALLRNIIESLPSSKNERVWLRNQSEGDLDENKLIEGLTGEKSVYKRRATPENEDDRDDQEDKPRLLSLVVDVSASMARFNSVDARLERELEALLMVMETLANQGDQKRVIYEIYGHSGESDQLEFVRSDAPPKNAKERLDLLQSMQAHTMFCMAGDSTISAIGKAVERMKKRHADTTAEKFIVLLSDANLSRYGIAASKLADAMMPPDLPQDVKVFALMIGSLGAQADMLVEALPKDQSYVCLDTAMMPQILQQILTTTLLLDD